MRNEYFSDGYFEALDWYALPDGRKRQHRGYRRARGGKDGIRPFATAEMARQWREAGVKARAKGSREGSDSTGRRTTLAHLMLKKRKVTETGMISPSPR